MPAPAESLPPAAPLLPDLPELRSEDGRLTLTATTLRVHDRIFGLLELEAVELTPVRWLLWYLLGGLVLAGFALAFLQNWLRTMPAAAGMTVGALLLVYGHRGTNRLRVHRLGREAAYFALPGELATWQPLVGEANRRIRYQHDAAAALAAQQFVAEPPPTAADSSFGLPTA